MKNINPFRLERISSTRIYKKWRRQSARHETYARYISAGQVLTHRLCTPRKLSAFLKKE